MEEINYGHKPVLLHECLDALAIKPDGVYLDGTLGRAGHSLEIVRRLTAGGRLIALDRDETAIEAAQRRLADYMDRVTLVHSNFSALDDVLRELGVRGVDGMLFDLGVSSPQLDETQRGFSYMHDAPLDMRMDATSGLSAWNVVNEWPENELKRILYEYGEETPRSKSMPSTASMPRRSRMAAVSRKLPCTSCTRSPNGASRAPARAIAVSSRSMPMSVPVVRRPAICSEWPPMPSVPST